MKKFVLLFTAFFAVVPMAWSQITHTAAGATDKMANETLRKVQRQFSQSVSFKISMTSTDSKQQSLSSQQATVFYDNGKYWMSFDNQELMCDGTTVWHWNKPAKEVTVSALSTDDVNLLNPASIIKNYSKYFRAKHIRTENDGLMVIDMQPLSGKSYHKIRLIVDGKTGIIKSMEVHKYDSSREIYRVENFKKVSVKASLFVFDTKQHPDVEVIDMR
ncbi:MAG: outer membrane lipoprotein carrier protein LolA [Bacteroidales bacterium]|nr:outer membrane lipoprotein carrier protein LolA [Bacteroidales bacterium]